MAGPDPHGDQRIEELLSQLQGIFSKLSTTEQAESQEKESLPPAVGSPAPSKAGIPEVPHPPAPAAASSEAPLIEHYAESDPAAAPLPVPPPASVPPPMPESPPITLTTYAPPPPVEVTPPEPVPAATPLEAPEDANTVRVAICFPEGNENEVKILSQKLETLTPKFTKISFKLIVSMVTSYKPKTTDWSEEFFAQAQAQNIRAYFFVVPRSMEEAKRKALAVTLEKFGIYYQEVPLIAIEKRAFYMDLLLGLVFFFDSHGLTQKPPPENA